MNRDEARDYILQRATDYLQRDKSGRGYICPICQDGDGAHGRSGITTRDGGAHFTCWRGCFKNRDIIDIIGLVNGIDAQDDKRYPEKLQAACKAFGITLDNQPSKPATHTQVNIHNKTYTTQHTQEEPDYTGFFLQANKDLGKTDYHRGLSLETLNRFKVGYVASWRHPKAPQAPDSPRLIIPTSKHSYLARDTRAELTEEQKKYSKSKVGTVHIFNSKAIAEAEKPIFIVEGELDALSIIDVGGEAIGLGSISNVRKLLTLLETEKPKKPFIIALDNETKADKQEIVAKAVKELEDGLDGLGIPHYRLNPCGDYKDANEALQRDRDALAAAVADAENIEEQALELEKKKLEQEAAVYTLSDFAEEIMASKKAECIPTGFKALDGLLDGGLYAGLYIVGAISSLGKTTLCLQIADQIAKTGKKVLVFSLEMARSELLAKSISRLTFLEGLRRDNLANAKTTRGILTRYNSSSTQEQDAIIDAITDYSDTACNLWITEGVGDITVTSIREKVEQFVAVYKEAPVVVIDYLQIIAPYNERYTDKQNTDKAVLELKRLSRDYRIPIIGISSFNRDNYTAPVNLASFKESGAIEYSSDVLIGLQYEGMDYQEGEADKTREKRIRELINEAIATGKDGGAQSIQVKVLKNRNGSKGDAMLDFYPMFNCFMDKKAEESGGWTRLNTKR